MIALSDASAAPEQGQKLNLPYPDIGDFGTWSVSSFKFGFGTECLRDDDSNTFWQYVRYPMCPTPLAECALQFGRPAAALHHRPLPQTRRYTGESSLNISCAQADASSTQKLALYLAFSMDDSYTPQALLIRAGTGLNDLQDVRTVLFDKPTGWVVFDVNLEQDEDTDT